MPSETPAWLSHELRSVLLTPPCNGCIHWNPDPYHHYGARQTGWRLCHSPAMQPDFSCFDTTNADEEE